MLGWILAALFGILVGVLITVAVIEDNLREISREQDEDAFFITKEGLNEIVRKHPRKFKSLKQKINAQPEITGTYFYFDTYGTCTYQPVTDEVSSEVEDDILYKATPSGKFTENLIY